MKLTAIFEAARSQGRAAFIPYVMAGYPNEATTVSILEALHESGADMVELGIPYGDPLADGPTIAAAGVRALENGIDVDAVLSIARQSPLPVVLFTYFNPVLQYGLERFADRAKDAGVVGVIVPDLAFEECTAFAALLRERGIDMPLLVAPSTPVGRAREIAAAAGGFVYVVSRLGVTGAGEMPNFKPLIAQLQSLRKVTEKPLAVGFGVSRPEHVSELAPYADGIIVGSALVDKAGGGEINVVVDATRALAASLSEAAVGIRPSNLS